MAFKPSTGGAGPPWSGIIDPSRAMDWKNVGMGGQNYGNVPHYTTICATFGTAGQASTFAQSATAAQVNAPVSTCPNQSVVFLNAGTYTFSSAMQILNKNGVVFRGAGPNKTIVKFTGSSGCNQGPNSHVCIQGSFLYSGGPPANLTTWTGGFALGATVVTLGSVAGLSPGQMIVLDQQNDTVDSGGVFECDTRDDLVTTQGPRGVNPGTLVGCDGGH